MAAFLEAKGWLALLAPLVSALLVLALIAPARRFGMVDHPGGRKNHDHPTPLVGGLAIFLAFLIVNALAGAIPGDSQSLLAAMALTVAVGVLDDAHEIGHRSKFFSQIAAALLVATGTSVHMMHFGDLFGFGDIELGKWAPLVTVVSIVGLMNAINMIDGVDGLAGSVVLPPLLIHAALAATSGQGRLAFELLALVGAVAGFLFFNLRTPWRARAAAFMGDTGGLLLGLLLAWYSIILAGNDKAPICPIVAVWLLAVPLLDMGSVMLLRLFQGKSPFHADRQHLHYVLLDAGYSVGQVVAMMSAASLAFGLLALAARDAGASEPALFLAFLVVWGGYWLALARPGKTVRVAALVVKPRLLGTGD
jgi:UDP-GlcNAc:undecaprenyl-phosphate GlcNAc-1-phosphate transferase